MENENLNTSNVVVRPLLRAGFPVMVQEFKYIQCCSSTSVSGGKMTDSYNLNTSNVVVRRKSESDAI